MKRSRSNNKSYPTWQQRDSRMLIWALIVGGIAAGVTALVIYLSNRGGIH